jgi:hypothetical protein
MPLASRHGGIGHTSLSNAREPWYRLCSRMWTLLASTCMAGRWIPAFAESTPQKHPSHWTNMLGGLEEHLASWTKGCEGQKGLGEMMTLQAGCLSVSVLPMMGLLWYPLSSAIDAYRRFCYNKFRAWQRMACEIQLRHEDMSSTGSTVRGIGKRPPRGYR